MKKAEREVYYVLANEVGYMLCAFCKCAKSCGCECEPECHHSLLKQPYFEDIVNNAMTLGDCWGFRPKYPVFFAADIIGLILANGWRGASWWQENGVWKIAGR